ncbi:MAG: hypothetical protein HBSAPP02_18530 [Phycisphaerae bacterium]|nr:MAG: hypothetical protein HBSAPP02_18530 [Phycisphaerae bacterium]
MANGVARAGAAADIATIVAITPCTTPREALLSRAACDPPPGTLATRMISKHALIPICITDFLSAAIMRGHKKTSVPRVRNGGG